MLKKLVKYGNSNALVLDKAILELMGLTEGDVVKLKINNDTLVITPASAEDIGDNEPKAETKKIVSKSKKVNLNKVYFSSAQERLMSTMPSMDSLKDRPEYKEWQPGSENFKKMTAGFAELQAKYAKEFKKMDFVKIQEEMDKWMQNSTEPVTPESNQKMITEVYKKHAPFMNEYQKEVKTMTKKLGLPKGF